MTQMDLIDAYPNTKEYTFLHLMEPSLKLTTDSIIKQISTDTKKNGIPLYLIIKPQWFKFRVQQHTNYSKPTNLWKLNNSQLNHHWVKEEIKNVKTS